MVSHFVSMNKALEVHLMDFIYILVLFNYNYCFDVNVEDNNRINHGSPIIMKSSSSDCKL
jgi:hypothetical protein